MLSAIDNLYYGLKNTLKSIQKEKEAKLKRQNLRGQAYKQAVLADVKLVPTTGFLGWLNVKYGFSWGIRERFYRHLSIQLKNGKALVLAMEDFYVRMVRENKVSKAVAIGHFIKKMHDGSTLTSAMNGWIPQDEMLIISSGENSKTLKYSLTLIIDTHKKIDRVSRIFKNSMKDPIQHLLSIYILLYGVGKWAMPSLIKILPREKAVGSAVLLYNLTDVVSSPWFPVPIVLLFILGITLWMSLPRWIGPYRVKAEKYFPFSFYRNLHGYIWLVGFASLSASGKASSDCIQMQMRFANAWLYERLYSIKRMMTNGASLPDAMDGKGTSFGFPHQNLIDEIRSMHEFEDFPQKLLELTEQWADELQTSMEDTSKRMGQIFNGIMVLIILTLVISINEFTTQMGSSFG